MDNIELSPEERRWLKIIVESYDFNGGEFYLRPSDAELPAIRRLVTLGLISFRPPMVDVRVENHARTVLKRLGKG